MRGRDIKRYSYEFADKWIIATFPSRNYNIDDYPAVKDYLLTFGKEKLEQSGKKNVYGIKGNNARKKTNNKWFETQDSIGYWEEFNKQKIVYSEIVQSPQFFLDKRGEFFVEATSFLITGEHLDYLVDWLNSPTIAWVFKQFYAGGGLGKKGFRYKKKFLEQLPIPKPRNDMKYKNTNNLIKAYLDLTDEEINFISSSVNL